MRFRPLSALLFLGALHAACAAAQPVVLRVGYFPNVTHAQAVIGAQSTHEGHGWFEQRLGDGVVVQWFAFNAGPGAMEALLAGSLDMTYVGPNPALNVYNRSHGDEIRVLAGAAEGGAALVIREGSGIAAAADFRGRRVATPQLGNTQDVAARVWLKRQGLRITTTGGDAQVIPTANADLLALFKTGRIDAAWTVEPWVSRLEQEAGGRIFLEQRDTVTTVLVASVRMLREQPELSAKFLAAHMELTRWLAAHPEEARRQVLAGLRTATRRDMPPELLAAAWPRLNFTAELQQHQMESLVADAREIGFLRDAQPLARMFSGKP